MTLATTLATLLLLLVLVLVASSSHVNGADVNVDIVTAALQALGGESEFKATRTACDLGDCAGGGCVFDRCVSPVSCSGGLCTFKRCKTAVCDGGLCSFDATDAPSCPGGGCRFTNMVTTLVDGYCAGGGCSLDGVPHPRTLSHELSG